MKRQRSKEVGLPWQTQVLAAVAEFDFAKAPSQRLAALRKLQSLFAGSGELKKVLRKCLALMRRAERLEACQIRTERRRNNAAREVPGSSIPINLPIRF